MSKNVNEIDIDFSALDKKLLDLYNTSKKPGKTIEEELKRVIENDRTES